MLWPWRKFEVFYDSHSKRLAAERVIELKHAMITGVWGNSNYDDGKDSRTELLRSIDDFAEKAINQIYASEPSGEYVEEVDMNNPFFAAMKVPKLETMDQQVGELPDGR